MTASNTSSSHPDKTGDQATMTDDTGDARQRIEHHYREIEQTYDDTRARLEDFNAQTVDFIRQNPAACIFGALAAGYLVGRLASRRWLV